MNVWKPLDIPEGVPLNVTMRPTGFSGCDQDYVWEGMVLTKTSETAFSASYWATRDGKGICLWDIPKSHTSIRQRIVKVEGV